MQTFEDQRSPAEELAATVRAERAEEQLREVARIVYDGPAGTWRINRLRELLAGWNNGVPQTGEHPESAEQHLAARAEVERIRRLADDRRYSDTFVGQAIRAGFASTPTSDRST